MKGITRVGIAVACAVIVPLAFIAAWPIVVGIFNFTNPMTESYSFYVHVNELNNALENIIAKNPEYQPPTDYKNMYQSKGPESFYLLYLKEPGFVYSIKTVEGIPSSADPTDTKIVSRLILRGGWQTRLKNPMWEDIYEFKNRWSLHPTAKVDVISPFEQTFIPEIHLNISKMGTQNNSNKLFQPTLRAREPRPHRG